MSDIRKKKTKWFKYVVLCFSMTWWTEKKTKLSVWQRLASALIGKVMFLLLCFRIFNLKALN